MMTEVEVVARFRRLNSEVLARWIAVGWLKPQQGETGFLFDDADLARTHFLCDLRYDMELADDELAMILSLVDRLHGTRALLYAVTSAVHGQPEHIRDAILAKAAALLSEPRRDDR
jgi:chaperone modulatory protein CbpM